MPLPVFFIILASATLLAALAALFVSLRAAFGGTSVEPLASGPGLPDRAALEDEKNSLLRALKDLEYEHEVGKIADADYERLERAYRMRAKQVLAELDRDLGPYLSQAEELIARSLGEAKAPEGAPTAKKAKKKGKAQVEPEPAKAVEPEPTKPVEPVKAIEAEDEDEDDDEEEQPAATASELPSIAAVRVCAKCTTKNDADAAFCKRCASPLGEPEATA